MAARHEVLRALGIVQQAGFVCIPLSERAESYCSQPVLRENKIGPYEYSPTLDPFFKTLVESLTIFTEEDNFKTSVRSLDRMIQAAYMARQSPARFMHFKQAFHDLILKTPISI